MGQKTNPTLLRLEKTNQHYKASWFSDRFYPEQLHHNYKSLQYLDKTFYKLKKTKQLCYIKAGYNFNQLICLLPKKRQRRFRFGKIQPYVKNSTINHTHLPSYHLFSILPYQGTKLLLNNNSYVNIAAISQDRVSSQHSNSKLQVNLVPNINISFASWYRQHNKQKQSVERNSNIQHKTNKTDNCLPSKLNNFYNFGNITTTARLSKLSITLFYNQLNKSLGCLKEYDVAKQIKELKKDHRMRMEQALRASSDLTFIKQNLFNLERVNKTNNKKTNISNLSYKLRWLRYISNPKNNLPCSSHYTTSIHFVKISHLQQSSSFLAQKIMLGLSNRVNFPRLRRQILWDVTKSKYVRGIRVTLSGRVESKSKKAQKARDRTFQWGQTELHVLSSLVQFTQTNLVTPFGKIGIKVWVCYGI